MSAKRPSLADSMRQVAEAPEPVAKPKLAAVPAAAPKPIATPSVPPPPTKSGYFAASRAGKAKVTIPLDPADKKQLNYLALELDKTNESLLIEAISDLFLKYGKPPIGQEEGAV
jgi:hypothetical protein